MKKNNFLIYTENIDEVEDLSMEQRGVLLTALMYYQADKELPEMDSLTRIVFKFLKKRIDKDNEAYEKTCERNRKNGASGGRPKKTEDNSQEPKKTERFSEKPKKADTDTDTDIDTDNNSLVVSYDTTCQTEVRRAVDAWNSLGLSAVKYVNPSSKRFTMLKARIKEHGIDDVLTAIDNINASDFLKGQNKNGWVITFDWFVKPTNFEKVFEGQYNNRKKTSGGTWLDRIDNSVKMVDDFYIIGGENDVETGAI